MHTLYIYIIKQKFFGFKYFLYIFFNLAPRKKILPQPLPQTLSSWPSWQRMDLFDTQMTTLDQTFIYISLGLFVTLKSKHKLLLYKF